MELQAVVLGQQQQLNTGGQASVQAATGQGQTPASVGTGVNKAQPTYILVLGNLSPQGHQFQQPQSPLASHHYNPYHFHPRAASPQYGQQPKKPPQYQMPTTAITIGDPPTSCFISSNSTPPSGQNSIAARNGMNSVHQVRIH
jgi:hypothetical protein